MISDAMMLAYENSLKACSEAALAEFKARVAKLGANPADTGIVKHYRAVCRKYGIVASKVATELYTDLRSAEPIKSSYKPLTMAGSTEPLKVKKGFSVQSAAELAIQSHIYSTAEKTLVSNAHRDPAKPKVAIVPHPGCCSLCISYGSRGFIYRSMETANRQRHQGCTCTPVIDFQEKTGVRGYDPDRLYSIYTGEEDYPQEWRDIRNQKRREQRAASKEQGKTE